MFKKILKTGNFIFNGVRILAFHDVVDSRKFEKILMILNDQYKIISVTEIFEKGGIEEKPPLIISFDDGYASVVQSALPVLQKHNVPAIMFSCPGVIQGSRTFWWDIVAEYVNYSIIDSTKRIKEEINLKRYLKSINDEKRREIVEEFKLIIRGDIQKRAADISMLKTWVDAGMLLGNHTWDHPILNMCSEEEQVRQIKKAHYAMIDMFDIAPKYFAYPNGNVSNISKTTLQQLGYEFAFLFDHKIAKSDQDKFEISRLRLDADASLKRTASIASGWHSYLFHTFK